MLNHLVEVRRTSARIGAACASVGALLAIVVNLEHGDLPDDPEAALTRVAATAGWELLHLGIIASVMLILAGLWRLSQVTESALARAVARLSLVLALPTAAVMLVGIAIDGFATKSMADLWAAAPAAEKPLMLHLAVATEEVQNGLFHMWAALFIGLPFVLMGISGALAGAGFPRWLGSIALTGGAGALLSGIAGFLHVPVPGVLFNVFAFVVTLWVLIAGVVVWRAPDRASVVVREARSAI
jgi:hypothetical protein